MKTFNPFLLIIFVVVLFSMKLDAQESSDACIRRVNGTSDSIPDSYVPPLISNGSLSMLVDFKGGQTQQRYVGMTPVIYWAGRRYGLPKAELIPFGHFEQEYTVNGHIYSQPDSWEQTLDTKQAVVTCRNTYGDALTVETIVFTHLLHDLIVIKKRFYTKSPEISSVKISFKYQFTEPGTGTHSPNRVISECFWNDKSQSIDFRYKSDGYKPEKGIISVLSDRSFSPVINGQDVSLDSEINLAVNRPAEITYYLLFSDSMDGDDYLERLDDIKANVRKSGYDKLLATHTIGWAKYWNDSYVRIPDKLMEKVYNTAQYHLRANATRWSFPVGIFASHWGGRYFGWDEMFCFQALASSNHLDISRRCPEFRYSTLPNAMYRVAHYGKPGINGARYPWVGLEDGTENASPGFYLDHVFHMSNIALSAWLQYLYSNDSTYLRTTGYSVIKECARFYVSQMVYEDCDGRMFIGKCTDLERLGPAIENPFMTVCGAIYTLEAAAKASVVLSTDKEEMKKWEIIATKLRENLPLKDGRYIPYIGCSERSVASLGGLFPYPIFDSGNTLQRNAVYDFVNEGKSSGNMYPVGNSLCAWYAGWLASALALLGDKTEPVKLLKEASNGSGCFSELFEINEPKVKMHPWFSTASGNYIYALNQMLIQCKEDQILIAPAVPNSWNDFSFKLVCYGNLVTTVSVRKGLITQLVLSPGNPTADMRRILIIPEQYLDKRTIKKLIPSATIKDGICRIEVPFRGETTLIKLQ